MSSPKGSRFCLTVAYGAHRVGRITSDESGVRLDYAPEWRAAPGAFPVSLSLPLRAEPYEGAALRGWLDAAADIAPEAAAVARLAWAGGDAPGAFTFRADSGPAAAAPPPRHQRLGALDPWLARLEGQPQPAAAGEAGAGRRALVSCEDGRIPVAWLDEGGGAEAVSGETADPALAVATGGALSTHWLWAEPAAMRGALENRLAHLGLADAAGLSTAEIWVGASAAGRRWLLTTRDDRAQGRGGWIRLRRESLLQAMGLGREHRAGRLPNAPSALEEVFRWADRALPAPERLKLLDVFLFHALIGAAAPFAQTIGLRAPAEDPAADLALAPLTLVEGPSPCARLGSSGVMGGERRFPHRVGGAARPAERLSSARWRRFAREADLNATFTLERLRRLGRKIMEAAPAVGEALAEQPPLDPALARFYARRAAANAEAALARLG